MSHDLINLKELEAASPPAWGQQTTPLLHDVSEWQREEIFPVRHKTAFMRLKVVLIGLVLTDNTTSQAAWVSASNLA